MTLRDVLANSSAINEDLVLYAKRVNGQLSPSSDAILLELSEDEQNMDTDEIANRKCPGFSYCMPMFLIHEMNQDLDGLPDMENIDKKIDRLIYYNENDA